MTNVHFWRYWIYRKNFQTRFDVVSSNSTNKSNFELYRKRLKLLSERIAILQCLLMRMMVDVWIVLLSWPSKRLGLAIFNNVSYGSFNHIRSSNIKVSYFLVCISRNMIQSIRSQNDRFENARWGNKRTKWFTEATCIISFCIINLLKAFPWLISKTKRASSSCKIYLTVIVLHLFKCNSPLYLK